jgi:uncharacterized membrane protein
MRTREFFKTIFRKFLQGLIILAPIAITIYAVTALFNFIDSILPDLVANTFPQLLKTDEKGNVRTIPGLGFVLVILIVIGVGYMASSFVVGRLVELFDKVLEKTPGIKLVYTTIKDFLEAFAGDKRKFDKSVLVAIESPEIWQIGFITQQEAGDFDLQDYVTVYIPHSYAFSGRLYFVKRDRVRLLPDLSSAEVMKFAISGGVTKVEEYEEKKTE